MWQNIGDFFLFLTAPVILLSSLILTVQTRGVQFRKAPAMVRMLIQMIFTKRKKCAENAQLIGKHQALFTAMSTTIGISTIVSPVIAIRMGGPGAIFGFLLATILGAAVSFTEVTLALEHRKKRKKGIAGGPMQYLEDGIHPFLAKWYALFTFLMLLGWSAAQANQLGEILASPLIAPFHIPQWLTGTLLGGMILFTLSGGIQRISNFSAKLVPLMFVIYVGAASWIIFLNLSIIPSLLANALQAAFHPQSFGVGFTVGGLVSALRWGVFKGLQSNECGIGTQTIPHSMAEIQNPEEQGILAMVATFSTGFICILSALVALVTESWLSQDLSLGINMVAYSFATYFSKIGIIIVAISSLLFALGTILGNSFNASQCFIYLSKGKFMPFFYGITACFILIGCIGNVQAVWSLIDYLIMPVALPHSLALIYLSYKQQKEPQAVSFQQ